MAMQDQLDHAWRLAAVAPLMLLAGAAGAQDMEVPAAPPQPIGYLGAHFTSNAYPAEALRARASGRVVATIRVDAAGEPAGCEIQTSSGSEPLDRGTCAIALARLRFEPARDSAGKAVASVFRLPVRWSLPTRVGPSVDLGAGPATTTDQTTRLLLDETGRVASCRSESPLAGAPDACAAYPPGLNTGVRAQRDGQPVPARMTMTIRSTVDAAGTDH